ncbi:MAG TPA: response regulator [Chryseosolibacter sp.]
MSNDIRILVVDDDKEDHLILEEYFSESGIHENVKFVENGLRAIEYLEGISEDAALPKLIVLDLNMPLLTGSQTLLQLKQNNRFKNIPVIIYSTSESDNEKRKCLSFGAIDYLVKPVTMEEGQRMVDKFKSFI